VEIYFHSLSVGKYVKFDLVVDEASSVKQEGGNKTSPCGLDVAANAEHHK
jgi:hypothetical protein